MPHDIIDNRNERLVDHIRRILPGSRAAKFAVGYFFLSGFRAIADTLENVGELRLLIGNTSNRQTIEQIAEGYRRLEQVRDAAEALAYPSRRDVARGIEETARAIGDNLAAMEQTEESERLVSELVRLIEAGRMKVRIYTKGRLHAKAYIFDYGPIFNEAGEAIPREERGIAIVGSSNLTLSGVSANTELNIVVQGNANHAELTRWFEELWDEAQPFEEHLMDELRQGWPLVQVTPYEIYLKTLYELVRDHLEEAEAGEFLWRDDITAVLADFQERAVRRAIQMIRRYGGCFVADVVGLGKSYIGAAIIKHFERQERARPLIICPAPLVTMWEHYNEAYQLNARVLSMGLLREREPYGEEWMLYDERYRSRDFVLVDESHNFRHTDNQRYRVLQNYLNHGDRRCVLLTATPRNKSIWDIYNQIKLFHPADVTALPIDPPNIRQYFRQIEKGEKRLPNLLSNLLIRRTRAHILRWYGYDAETDRRVDPDDFRPYKTGERRAYVLVGGRKQFFPKRHLTTIEYSIEATYQGLYEQLRRCFGRPGGSSREPAPHELTYARYGLWNYVRPFARERSPYAELQRAGANLRGLMRIMLFKRFESSVHAFRETIRRLLRIHRLFLAAMDKGIVPAGEEAQTLLYESDQDEEQVLFDALRQVTGRYVLKDFDAQALHADIEQDARVLSEILSLIEPITPAQDTKLQTLIEQLVCEPLNQGKRLIFTQYADTAQYLYDNLDPEGRRADIEVIYSQDKNKAEIVGRFAPVANPEQRPPKGVPEIDTLIATDVLAEGLNLQDGDKVINYDLHWNPVRLIQRFGRIDRIGSEHEAIYAYNFLPEIELERNLHLRQKLTRRIQEIHETIGEDAAILDPSEHLNEEAMYAIYAGGDISVYEEDDVDEFVDLYEAEEIVRQLREDQPELFQRIASLRDGIRCGRALGQRGTFVFCRAGRYKQLYLVDSQGEVVRREIPSILYWLKCPPDTSPVALPPDHSQRVMAIKGQFDDEVRAQKAERQHTLALTRAQRYVLRALRVLYSDAEDENVRGQAAYLESIFRQSITKPAVRSELNRIHREKLVGLVLPDRLSHLYSAHALGVQRGKHTPRADENDDLPRVICSLAEIGSQTSEFSQNSEV